MSWIKITDKLPESVRQILIAYTNSMGKERVTEGWYASKYSLEADLDFDDYWDYNEEKDQYYYKEGWRSQCWESEYSYPISNVTHWMEKPKHPNKL